MNKIEATYLSALRTFVHNTAPDTVSAEDWDALLHLAEIHSTGGILCYVYTLHPEQVPAELRAGLRRRYLQKFGMYAQKAELLRQLTGAYSENGIDCILLKGAVVRDYYPVPELRTFSDADLVIRAGDREKSDRVMQALGYLPEVTWEPTYTYRRDWEYYEIHANVLEMKLPDEVNYSGCFRRIWDHTVPSQAVPLPHILELDPVIHFLYLLTHIAKHVQGSGAGIRMYLDLAFFLRRFGSSLDWSRLLPELEQLSLTKFANTVLTAVEQWFGVESRLPLEPVDHTVMADFLQFTLAGGIYGYIGRDKSLIALKQQDPGRSGVSRWKTLLHRMFPPLGSLENRYPYLLRHPWLLPVAWIHRLITNTAKLGSFANHTKKILTADEEAVLELRRICKDIGL